jgi:hypothetical protein
MAYPRLHWLYYVEFALAVASYVVQIPGLRRARAKARGEVISRDSSPEKVKGRSLRHR